MYLGQEENLFEEIENISNQALEGISLNQTINAEEDWTNLYNFQSEQLDTSQDPVGSSPILTKIRGQLLENHKIKFHGKI